MKSVSTTLINRLRKSHHLRAVPKVTFEWNHNRYGGILKVDNTPAVATLDGDEENFPIASIVEPQRPVRGIIKARTSPARTYTVSLPWRRDRTIVTGDEGFTTGSYTDTPDATRYYTVGPDAAYKYWTSPAPSAQSASGPDNFSISNVQPYVMYKSAMRTNKIVVGLEDSWARPTNYDIEVMEEGDTSWNAVQSNLVPDENGRVVIYRGVGGLWSQTKNLTNPTKVKGVRLTVRGMSHSGAYFNLIELSARLEEDMSPYVIGYNVDMEISDQNFLTPIGKASSNTASVTLSNENELFNNENDQSVYYGLIDKNILVTCELEYDLSEIGGTYERTREFTMYIDQWSGTSDLELTAECKDSSKFLQEQKVPQMLLQAISVGEGIWRLCDSVGFGNFHYSRKDTDPVSSIEYFWTEKDNTVWEAIQSLAEATQTAVYFDEFDQMQIKTREAAYDTSKAPAWNFSSDGNGDILPDIVEANISADYEANVVNITYTNTKISDDNKGFPEMQVLWTPEDTFVLRAARLAKTLPAAGMAMQISARETAVWPYEGLVNIEGELIRYRGKEYAYYNRSRVLTRSLVRSLEEKNNIDNVLTHPDLKFQSTWTGRIHIIERGVYWTSPRDHSVDIAGWAGRVAERNRAGTTAYQAGVKHNPDNSTIRLTPPPRRGGDSLFGAFRGNHLDAHYRRYGTRVRLAHSGGSAGICIFSGPFESGYYIELTPTVLLDANNGAMRRWINEVRIFGRYQAGNHANILLKGAPANIVAGVWYDLDVDLYIDSGGGHNFIVYLNGIVMIRGRIASGRVTPSGRFGLYVRGNGSADFEYMFAHSDKEPYRPDEVSQFDKIRGGYVSGQWDREYVYGVRSVTRRVGNKSIVAKQNYNQYFFDEFGPIAHEVREMEIPFEKYPALHSRLYLSNDTQILCPEYNSDPFNAKFMLANTSRRNAVASGEDTLRFGIDNPVTQQMMIYGRLVFQEEGQIYTAKADDQNSESPVRDQDSIRRRGKVEVDIDGKWIQSKAEAQALGNWILKHWSGGSDEIEMEVFGNPLLQLGDVVSVDYEEKNLKADSHRYFVVSIRNSFDRGLSTELVLRRAKI